MKLDVDYEDYLEAEVFDRAGRLVGNLDCYWEDEDGETEFLGIKMKSVPGKTAVVPTRLAEANERKSCVLLGLGEPTITEGPSIHQAQYIRVPVPATSSTEGRVESPCLRLANAYW